MAFDAAPHAGVPIFCIPIIHQAQITADDTTGVVVRVPVKCRVFGVGGACEAIGGTTPFTDVDLVFKNVTKSETIGTSAIVESSAIASGYQGVASAAVADLDAGDEVEMEIDTTGGGGSPTADGITGYLWCARE